MSTEQHARPVRRADLVGTWRLLAYTAHRHETEGSVHPLGKDATGFLIYTADGYMSVQMMHRDRPYYDLPDVQGGNTAQFAAAASGYVAYAGRYDIDATSGVIRHLVDVSLLPNWLRGVQVRRPVLTGNRLVMHAEYDVDGVRVGSVLSWQRAPMWSSTAD